MLPPSKQKRKLKEQPRTADGKYNIKKTCNDSRDSLILEVSYNDDNSSDFFGDSSCYFNDDSDSFNDNGGSSSSFVNDIPAGNINFEFFNDEEVKNKAGPYKIGKIPKSTYYDKYGPNGILTKAAVGTEKITNFFKISNTQITNPQLSNTDTLEVFSSNSESEVVNPYTYKITEKIKDLKE
ncbi:unnamed protein product [Rhizophagus irregularis]|nr:unnamed protein product [Rhizophagus irregularis]